jgi:pimeloyl-ACP methyl ester carboxylesterase
MADMQKHMIRSADGTGVAFWKGGIGPALLLVHGTLAEHTVWNRLLPYLKNHFTVSVIERRGRGESGESDNRDYALQREAEDVAAVVEAIGGSVDVLAHSYGSVVALEAARLTDRIGRLLLYEPRVVDGPVGKDAAPEIDEVEETLRKSNREAALRIFYRNIFRTPDHEVERLSGLPYWSERLAVIHTVPREIRAARAYRLDEQAFKSFDKPVVLLRGTLSPPVFKETQERLQAIFPIVEARVLDGQAHLIMLLAPEVLAAEVFRSLLPVAIS